MNSRKDRLESLLESLLDTWPSWDAGLRERPQLIGPVLAGRTNQSYRLRAAELDEELLLRINHPRPERLGIDRQREFRIQQLSQQAGISRPFHYWDPAQRFVVFPWLQGRAWTRNDLHDPQQRARLWPLLHRLHRINPGGPRRSYLTYLDHYWRRIEDEGLADRQLEQAWQQFRPHLAAFDRSDWSAGLVHHDLVPDNIIETDSGLYLIDWEYAACGHPDIDIWAIDPDAVKEPFIPDLMAWVIDLWERLIRTGNPGA